MNPVKEALPFIKSNQLDYRIEWINTGRISPDFKLYIYGRINHGKQIGIYARDETVIRLERYNQSIDGVSVLPECPKSHAAESSYSNFKRGRGVCVKVENLTALKDLLDWYFGK